MFIKFCGAARTVTGSCHLLTLDSDYKILLDCGLYQGNDPEFVQFNKEWLFEPSDVDVLILSHAHIDHSGRIPKLIKDGFKGNIICTKATEDLCSVLLMDSAMIQQKDAEYNKNEKMEPEEPLYTVEDVKAALQNFVSTKYDKWFKINDELEVLFRDSGHILGSASVTLKITSEDKDPVYFGFTGDIGRPNRPILKDPVPMPQVDYIICESTYGDRLHEDTSAELERFLAVIKQTCVIQKGKLIIPAFSVGRTQEIVYMLDQLENEGRLPKIPVFVDSPMAVNATEIYRINYDCFDREIADYMLTDPDPFGFNELHYITRVEDSKILNDFQKPCIIISASGMMEGGRIRHHLFNHIENGNNTLLIVGFAAPQTLGGKLRAGAKEIRLFNQVKEVRAKVIIMDSFSAHGDRDEMLQYLNNQNRVKLKKIYLVHGDYDVQFAFREALLQQKFSSVEIPSYGTEFEI